VALDCFASLGDDGGVSFLIETALAAPFDLPVEIRKREGLGKFDAAVAFASRDDVIRSGVKGWAAAPDRLYRTSICRHQQPDATEQKVNIIKALDTAARGAARVVRTPGTQEPSDRPTRAPEPHANCVARRAADSQPDGKQDEEQNVRLQAT
jgi:hypothetical protein